MGNAKSKNKVGVTKRKGKKQKGGNANNGGSQYAVPDNESHDEEFEDIELKLLRRAIKVDPESFVLNNLMMCVQFFENYEEEIDKFKSTLASSREAELNERLPPQKHVLLPDVLQEHIARYVGFTSTRQTFRPTIEPLQPVRIYVVHDNIDVTAQNYSTHYSSVNDAVTYNMLLKPSDHQGYVKLQLLEDASVLRCPTAEEDVDLSSIAEGDDEFYSDGDSIYGTKPNSRMNLTEREKRDKLRTARGGLTRSLPDLHHENAMYDERRTLSSRDNIHATRSSQDVKAESDYEHVSSNEERRYRAQRIWSKRENAARRAMNPRSFKQKHRPRNHWTNRSPSSSTSSGYRSGTYAVDSDSDCSCNAVQNYSRRCNCSAPNGCSRSHARDAPPVSHSCAHRGDRSARCAGSVHGCDAVRRCNATHKCHGVAEHDCHPTHSCSASCVGGTTHSCSASCVGGTTRSCSASCVGGTARSCNASCVGSASRGCSCGSQNCAVAATATCCDSAPAYAGSQSSQNTSNGTKETLPDSAAISNSEIPRRCFKKVTYTSDGKVYDPREARKQLLNSKQRRIVMALKRHNYNVLYVSSVEFMRHFIDLFVDQYADALGFDRDAVDDVKPDGCVIYCDKVMVSHPSRYSKVEPYEVIPTVWLEWPESAQEWLDRPRSTWPSYDDIAKVKEFGCYIVPEGFLPKNGNNGSHDIEWQLTFPAAERYLETCMTRTQVQVYLIALMLHKTFIRPVFDTIFGLTTSHIRNRLFWMIEENDRPSKWPENRSGECLIQLLNSLYHCISQNEPTLSDYFVRDRNLFQRVPSEHLLHTQKQLKRIIENPIMYVFHAMENVRYSQKFFPRLDYELLLKILTVDALALVNPALGRQIFQQTSDATDESAAQEKDERIYRPGAFWDNARVKKDQSKMYTTRPVTNKTLISPRKATDSIIEISIRCAELDGPRLSALLDFFVRHFIKMAERCHQYRAYPQKGIYLDQAERLSILLFEHTRYRDDARAYRDKIKALRRRCGALRSQTDPPETPRRNMESAIFVAPLKDRFSRESVEQSSAPSGTGNYERAGSECDSDDRSYGATAAVVHRDQPEEHRRTSDSAPENERDPVPREPEVTARKEATPTDPVTKDEETSYPAIRRVVSLAEDTNESFLTETTYI